MQHAGVGLANILLLHCLFYLQGLCDTAALLFMQHAAVEACAAIPLTLLLLTQLLLLKQ
jgi:hypothetical protein